MAGVCCAVPTTVCSPRLSFFLCLSFFIFFVSSRWAPVASGLITSLRPPKPRRGELDYGVDIPFEEKPPPGFHAVGSDETPEGNLNFANIRYATLHSLSSSPFSSSPSFTSQAVIAYVCISREGGGSSFYFRCSCCRPSKELALSPTVLHLLARTETSAIHMQPSVSLSAFST